MTLEANIFSMDLPVAQPELRSPWLRKIFGVPPLALPVELIRRFELKVEPGEVVTVVGESAAGKTTLLRILAGLETRFHGEIVLNGERIRKPDRRIYLMPQEHTLLPWFTAEQNLLFFACQGDGADSRRAAQDLLASLALGNRRHAYPSTLSGGERRRTALACAMIAEPQVLLLDEPFRSLDQVMTEKCEDNLISWLHQTEQKASVVIVSHSISNAVFLGDRLIVVKSGPLSVYREFQIPSGRTRRSPELVKLEGYVLDALNEIAAQKQHAADGAMRHG